MQLSLKRAHIIRLSSHSLNCIHVSFLQKLCPFRRSHAATHVLETREKIPLTGGVLVEIKYIVWRNPVHNRPWEIPRNNHLRCDRNGELGWCSTNYLFSHRFSDPDICYLLNSCRPAVHNVAMIFAKSSDDHLDDLLSRRRRGER